VCVMDLVLVLVMVLLSFRRLAVRRGGVSGFVAGGLLKKG